LIFAVDAVGGFGEQFAWGFLAEDELVLVAVGDLIGWVGLTEAELSASLEGEVGMWKRTMHSPALDRLAS
jgi:hypothetical protein